VVFLFQGDWRATIVPMVVVPISLIGAFAFLLAFGFSANTVTLLALVVATGIVVDDAIVVVENVERVMAAHPELPPRAAAKLAMTQITAPIIAISLVLLSVFVPIAFIPGLSGLLFQQFAVTVSIAMLISALNALTLSPALCALLIRPTHHRRGIMGRILTGIDDARDSYSRVVTPSPSAPASSPSSPPAGFCPPRTRARFSPRSPCRPAPPSTGRSRRRTS
jgi:multidrug efflux pump subunit AcrB